MVVSGNKPCVYFLFFELILIFKRFPLSLNQKDDRYFQYGLYLLNRNIERLRSHFNIRTYDLADALLNVYTLLTRKHPQHVTLSNNGDQQVDNARKKSLSPENHV